MTRNNELSKFINRKRMIPDSQHVAQLADEFFSSVKTVA